MDNGSERWKLMFKPVAGGWVYRAPNPWVFGDAPHYLVNDAQKAQIEALMVSFRLPAYLRFAGGAALVVALLGNFRHLYGNDEPSNAILVPMAALFAISLFPVEIWLRRRRLEPILSGLPLTNERITFAERWEQARAARRADSDDARQGEERLARLIKLELLRRSNFNGPIDE